MIWRRRLPLMLLFLLVPCVLLPSLLPAEQNGGRSQVNFNFDRVDIRLLVKLVGEITGMQFVVDDSVKAEVTVVTPAQIPADEVYPLFVSILESSGYSIIRKGTVSHIVPLASREVPSAPVRTGDTSDAVGIITKVIRLQYIDAVEMRAVLLPMVSGGKTGSLSAFGPTNHLLITDTAENIARIEEIIAELDKKGSNRIAEVVPLKNASAAEVAAQINMAIEGGESAGRKVSRHMQQVADGRGAMPTEMTVVPVTHANSLLLVGTPANIEEIKRMLEQIDTESLAARGPLSVIFLKYLSAEAAAKSLNALLEKSAEKDQKRSIAIEPDIANNALLLHGSPRDCDWVRELVDQLDQVPQQVLVEILIAEVSVGKNLDLGVEWSTIDVAAEGRTTVLGRSRPGETDTLMDYITQGVLPQGLAVGVARGTYTDASGAVQPSIPVLLRALAQNRDIKILSNIPLWAQNNTEASVSVVENIPILKSTIEGGAGTARDTIQNIDRIDVGIKLKLTPHVNPDREVTIELNPSIEAIIDTAASAELPFTPTITKREVATTVTVKDKTTIAISGLIRDDQITTVYKVPLLGDIPLLGMLFRSTSRRAERTNLLIFVTPHIVTEAESALAARRSWEDRSEAGSLATNYMSTIELRE
ncbi:MAG TPA: type II secretion system secretin GspD [Kiritimatiellia bacterium]|nr:type II secretion system secretin GspD [Kiritimatiellia bacterium]HQQ03470.1 type II secretion system secretin GspD [Kiritimatiellia bacterium]